jgi:hypothetical protein
MAHHNCPSCGFEHPSEGAEVPSILVNAAALPTLPVLEQFLRESVERFGLKLGNSVESVLQAMKGEAERGEQLVTASLSVCPLCGPAFTSDNAEAFNDHMRAHQRGEAVQPAASTAASIPAAGEMSPELRAALGL